MYKYLLLMTIIILLIISSVYIAIIVNSPRIELMTQCIDAHGISEDLPSFIITNESLYALGSIGGRLWHRGPLLRDIREVEFLLRPSYLRYKSGLPGTPQNITPLYVRRCTIYLLEGSMFSNITLTYTYLGGNYIAWGPPRELLTWGKRGALLLDLIDRHAILKVSSCNYLQGSADRLVVDIDTFKSLIKTQVAPTGPQPWRRYSFVVVVLLELDGDKIPVDIGGRLISLGDAVKSTVNVYLSSSSYNLTVVKAIYNTYTTYIAPSTLCVSINYVTTISGERLLRSFSLLLASSSLLAYDYKRSPKAYRRLFSRFRRVKELARKIRRS